MPRLFFHYSPRRACAGLITFAAVAMFILFTSPLFTSTARAENWPQWRGPGGDSISGETGLPLAWSAEQGIAWKVDLPEWGTSTPVIWGDAIFLTAHQEDRALLLLKINKQTQAVEWTRQVGVGTVERMPLRKKDENERQQQKFHQLHNMASPSPVTDGEIVVVHFGNGDLAAYDFEGEQLWKRNLQEDHGQYTIWWGHANSPVLDGDLVISACMQDSLADLGDKPTLSYVVAHDKRTGEEVWTTPRMTGADAEQGDAYTTPVFWRGADGPQMIIMGGNQVDAYDPASGRRLWRLPGVVGGRTITGPTIGVGQGRVFVTQGMRGPLLAVPLDASGELSIDDVAWSHESVTPDTCCPVVWNDLLFIVSDNGVAQCLDAASGELVWKERLGGNFKASPVAAEGRIYFLSMEGRATVVAASRRFESLAENVIDDEFIASPAVSDGRIYLRGRAALYAIGDE